MKKILKGKVNMRKVRYFITKEANTITITGTFEVSDTTTEEEINDMVAAEVAANVHGNKWSADWKFID